jgi:mono/diheme cytochrome c family protein
VRATILAAGGLACAGAAMTIAAFAGGGSAADRPPASTATRGAERGLEVFTEQGCGSCHAFKPAGSAGAPFAPDLALSLHGKSHDYVLESIVLPNASAASGWSTGMMPDDFGRRIAPRDLEPLVQFLMQGAR